MNAFAGLRVFLAHAVGKRLRARGAASHTRLLAALGAAALALGTTACGGPAGPVDGARARAHVEKILSFGPRPPGSEGLRRAGDYIVAELERIGLTAQEQKWQQTVEVYGKPTVVDLRNIWTQIPGKDPENGPILMLAAHYDSKKCTDHPKPEHNFDFVGALDAGASCGLLLELARVLHDRQMKAHAAGDQAAQFGPNVWICWFDGEECLEFDWVNEKSLLGSTHFVSAMEADRERFPQGLADRLRVLVLLDLLGDVNMKIDQDQKSNPDLIRIFAAAAAELGESERVFRYKSPMYDDHVPFKNKFVSVIDLIDFRWRSTSDWSYTAEQWKQQGETKPPEGTYTAWWHTPQDNLAQVSASSLAFTGNLVLQALPAIEQKFYPR